MMPPNTEEELIAILAVLEKERKALDARIAACQRHLQKVCKHLLKTHFIAGNGTFCTKCGASFGSDDDQTDTAD